MVGVNLCLVNKDLKHCLLQWFPLFLWLTSDGDFFLFVTSCKALFIIETTLCYSCLLCD